MVSQGVCSREAPHCHNMMDLKRRQTTKRRSPSERKLQLEPPIGYRGPLPLPEGLPTPPPSLVAATAPSPAAKAPATAAAAAASAAGAGPASMDTVMKTGVPAGEAAAGLAEPGAAGGQEASADGEPAAVEAAAAATQWCVLQRIIGLTKDRDTKVRSFTGHEGFRLLPLHANHS